MTLPTMNDLKNDLHKLKKIYEVVIFGSYVEGGIRPTSDVDIAVITRLQNNIQKNLKIQKEILRWANSRYDLRVFELFPIQIQIAIIRNHQVLFGNPLEISEYFYYYRKKWNDQKYRLLENQFNSIHQQLDMKY